MTQHIEVAGRTTILDWMDRARAAARAAPWAELFDFGGVDALDVLASPIYLALLGASRGGSSQMAAPSGYQVGRARYWAFRAKTAWRKRKAARGSAAAGPTDILFWSRDITHTDTMQAVAAAVAKLGDRSRVLACEPSVFAGLQRYVSDPVYTLGAWPRTVHAAHRDGLRRARKLAATGPWKLPGSAAQELDTVLRTTVIDLLPLVSEAIANARAALDVFRPRVLVVGNDLTTEGRAGCRVAAGRGVPTAVFMHGSVMADAMLRRHCADRLLVYGDIQRRLLLEHGISAEHVVACGAPNLDRRPRQSAQAHPLLQAKLGLRADEPWILVVTSGPGHRISHKHHQVVIEQLERLSREFPRVPVVVKLHRKDRVEYYRAAQRRCAATRLVVVPADTPGFPREIFDWLQGCRVALTGASTVATEAMLMNVPVITMDFCDEVHEVDFIDAGATVHVRSGDALVEQVREILSGNGPPDEVLARVRTYLKSAFCALDGRSAERGAQALHAMFEPQDSR